MQFTCDDIVRFLQDEVLKRIKNEIYFKERNQRELLIVAQRNFRKYMQLRRKRGR